MTSPDTPKPIATIEYELTDDLACQAALDLLDRETRRTRERFAEWGRISPVVILLGVALQLLIGIAAVIYFGGWKWRVAKVLVSAGVVVEIILLWKAAFYGLPSFARWYLCRRARRHVRGLAHRRIRWLVYDDRLETESATMQRKIAWTDISRMTPCGQSVVLTLVSGVELSIPSSVLTAEVRSLIARLMNPR